MNSQFVPAKTLSEALDVLTEAGERARIVAGGTALVSSIVAGRDSAPEIFLSLHRVEGLGGVSHDGTSLRIGALATLTRVERDDKVKAWYPGLVEAISCIGSAQVRNVGTLVGNLCGALPSADAAVALLSIGAKAVVVSKKGEREVDLADFYAGQRKTCLARGELVKEVVLPAPAAGTGSAYMRVSPRSAMDGAMVAASLAATLRIGSSGVIEDVRIGLGALAPTPIRGKQTEAALKGQKVTAEVLEAAGQAAASESDPVDHIRGSVEYRRAMARVLVKRVVEAAAGRAQGTGRRA